MSPARVAVAVIILTAAGYLLFPGHTYLQQDNQIYVPILEHLHDPAVLAADQVAVHQHVSFTVYDELMRLGRWATGLGFEPLMAADQLLFRAIGILAVFLIATSLGLSRRLALVVAAVYGLSSWVHGPEVLTIEYEPKPRSSALPALLLAIGLMAHRRYVWGTVAAAVALLYHPPTVYPFLLVYGVWLLRPRGIRERIRTAVPLWGAVIALWALAHFQTGGAEPSSALARIDDTWKALLRVRLNYTWISVWWPVWIWHYLLLWAVSLAATLRLRRHTPEPLRYFVFGLPLIGMLSLPAGYLLLDQWKLAWMIRFQPARALLFIVLFAVILATAASLRAATARRIPEAIAWGLAVVLFFAASPLRPTAAPESLETRELRELSEWASEATPRSAVFHFADAGRNLEPGIFRARALRAVYADWKGGGQMALSNGFAAEWWHRWQESSENTYEPGDELHYKAMGIDYYVLGGTESPDADKPLFENARYRAYPAR